MLINESPTFKEPIDLAGILFVYDNQQVTIDEHEERRWQMLKSGLVIRNKITTSGKQFILTGSLSNINEVRIGNDGSIRLDNDPNLKNPLFSAQPTDKRVVGVRRITELFVGVLEANFIHREFGIFSAGTLISTLVVSPEFDKTNAKTRTYIHEMGWF